MAITREQNSVIDRYILIGRCDCDNNVKFPFYWSEEIIIEATKLGYRVIDLKRENFIEEKFTKHTTDKNPLLIFLNGHGDEISAMGFQQKPVLILNKNDYLLKNKVAHIISCKTAALLGQFAKDKGCKGYIGYQGLFSFKNAHPDPKKDIFSTLFMDAVNTTSKFLLRNPDVKEAFLKSQEIYSKYIEELRRVYWDTRLSDAQRDFISGVVGALEENKKSQVFF